MFFPSFLEAASAHLDEAVRLDHSSSSLWIRGLRVTLPAFILGQTVAMYTNTHNLPYWLKIAHAILNESAKFG